MSRTKHCVCIDIMGSHARQWRLLLSIRKLSKMSCMLHLHASGSYHMKAEPELTLGGKISRAKKRNHPL